MDTEREVTQFDSDLHEIYRLLKDLRGDVVALKQSESKQRSEQWGMLRRQGERLYSLEANVAQLADDMVEVKANVAGLASDLVLVKSGLSEVLELLRDRPS